MSARNRRLLAVLATVGAVATAGMLPASAATPPEWGSPGGLIYSTGGTATVTIHDSEAQYRNELYSRVGDDPREFIGDNMSGEVSAEIGPFTSGDEIIFEIDVFDGVNEEPLYTLSTGPGSRNPDGSAHALAFECGILEDPEAEPDACMGNEGDLWVGFEDLLTSASGYDGDYNDQIFTFDGSLTRRLPTTLIANPSLVDVDLSPVADIYLQVSAKLTGPSGGIGGQTISFHPTGPLDLTGDPLCTAITSNAGLASCGFLLDGDLTVVDTVLGIGQYEARYAGIPGTVMPETVGYAAATDIGPIVAVLGAELLAT